MVRVLVDVRSLHRAFDYLVPPGVGSVVRVGTQVRVPLRGRRVAGWVVEVLSRPPGDSPAPLKTVARISGAGPPPELVELSEWASWRWAGARTAFLRTASPPRMLKAIPARPATRSPALPARGDEVVAAALGGPRAVLRLPPGEEGSSVLEAVAGAGDALVLAPTAAGVARVVASLRGLGVSAAVMPDAWALAAAGATVVGTRAAAWAPCPRARTFVVLCAHDEVYKEERAPAWSAWQVVAERARRAGVPCVLVTPCPTLEQLEWGRLVVPPRTRERAGWPALQVVDRRGDDPRTGLYSEALVRAVRQSERVAMILNRTGRARLMVCAPCGAPSRCEACAAAVSQGDEAASLRCGRCGLSRPAVCAACGSTSLRALRPGVTKVREELERLLRRPVAEVTARTEGLPGAPVLVGTEALLRRLPPGGVDLVAFLEFDQEMLAPRYRAAEEALAQLALAGAVVGGRAGGGGGRGGAGRVLVQTRVPDHEVVAAGVLGDPGRVEQVERARRRDLQLPPASALAAVSGQAAAGFAEALADQPVDVLAVAPDRWLVRAVDTRVLCDALAATPRPAGRLRVEVDPLRA